MMSGKRCLRNRWNDILMKERKAMSIFIRNKEKKNHHNKQHEKSLFIRFYLFCILKKKSIDLVREICLDILYSKVRDRQHRNSMYHSDYSQREYTELKLKRKRKLSIELSKTNELSRRFCQLIEEKNG